VKRAFRDQFHKRKSDHGPFDFFQCDGCGSGLTLPPPPPEKIACLYQFLEFGMSPLTRHLMADSAEAAWHKMCATRIAALSGRSDKDQFTWMDVGAGGGEVALAMTRRFPCADGLALDIHEIPPALRDVPAVQWRRINISNDDFSAEIGQRAEVVFATGVWEHVRRPDIFARNLLSLMKPGGLLYMTTPNYGSLARHLFGRSWPYFLPGEHLCMPTPRGAWLCLSREAAALWGDRQAEIRTRPILVRYGLRFVLTKLGLPRVGRLFAPGLSSYFPSGAMESIVKIHS
jgi:SAM-dependent methyltransferase